MKAILLAAGKGTRLKPFTDEVPKCLMDLGGVPILERWLQKLEDVGCEEVVINTHHHANQVEEYLANYDSASMKIKVVNERLLKGTAGTLLANLDTLDSDEDFLIHCDNAMEDDLTELIKKHRERPEKAVMTVLTFKTKKPQECGILKTNEQGIITDYWEKDERYNGDTANGATFVLGRAAKSYIKKMRPEPYDFCKDVLPLMKGRALAVPTKGIYIDIGSPETLRYAQALWHRKVAK